MTRGVVLAFVTALLVSAEGAARGEDAGCATYAAPVAIGRVPATVPELSGLAASRRHAGIYWTHNDSGHAFVLYAMRETGAVVVRFPLEGGTGDDVEDIATGPCGRDDPRPCVYLADTGDNAHARPRVAVFRVVEPEVLEPRTLHAERLAFVYPDGAHDTEALLVDPRTAELVVITKALFGSGEIYRIETSPGRTGHAVALGPLGIDDVLVTAASVVPGGGRALVRTYRSLWEFRRPGAANLAELLAATPRRVPTISAGLGEAVSYTADGRGYVLAGEGEGTAIHRVDCALSAPPPDAP